MPDDYYVSQYSGEEIDDLLGKAGSATGTVRYDAAQTLTDAQKTKARGNINAAPGGYGLGTSCVPIGTQSLDTITNNGWYQFGEDNTTAPVYAGELFVMKRTSDGYCTQVIYYAGSYLPCFLVRKQTEGTWSDWEWVNPPMQLGVEYRTTERYLGKPVYVRTVDFGDVPNATTKRVGAFPNYLFVDHIVGYTAEIVISGNRFSLPIIDDTSIEQAYCWLTYDGFSIKTTDDYYSNLSATANFTVKYTKTTD